MIEDAWISKLLSDTELRKMATGKALMHCRLKTYWINVSEIFPSKYSLSQNKYDFLMCLSSSSNEFMLWYNTILIFVPLKGTPTWHLHTNRVLNKSWQPVKFADYFTWTCRLIFFGNYSPKKPKYHDVYLLFKHSNFASECWKCTLRGPVFKVFPRGMPSDGSSLGTHAFNLMHASRRALFSSSLPTPKLLPRF